MYSQNFPCSRLHDAFLLRRFDMVNAIKNSLAQDEWERALQAKGPRGFEWITPLVCAKWNLHYLYGYDDKYGTGLVESMEPLLEKAAHIEEAIEYTDIVDKDGNDIFHIFWPEEQPMLDVVCYERQELASKQVENNKFSIVMDEVGTGKTVSALYAMRDVIRASKKRNEQSRILVVCPYNKREDWQNDIRRQLGRYAHIVDQADPGLMYCGDLKKVFFKGTEEIIMITGPKKGSDSEGPYTALKGSLEKYSEHQKWHLVIIDEGHISFQNYRGIEADKAMLLTATPIVVNAKEKRNFQNYLELLGEITGQSIVGREVNPIRKYLPDSKDVYVNWFREDMGKNAAGRRIQFVPCKRHADRNDIFYQIRDKAGTLAALQYDQDDSYLFDAAINRYGFGNIKELRKNGKIEKLVEILKSNHKSYIVFCEHQYVVDLIFDRLKNEFAEDVVAEKFGKYENQYGLGNVQDGQLINTLMHALRLNRRVLFITTGKTGGTGLNLGEFDGVIHYELPFTSIELEQRFGRVDRIDAAESSKSRDMIFLLNECGADENDLEINRMLYYCTTKIDVTCQFMPVRNTVLYYPEFIKRNGAAIRDSLVYFQNQYVLSETNESRIKEIRRTRRGFENDIRKSDYWEMIRGEGKTVRECVLKTLRSEKNSQLPDSFYEYLSEYIEYLKSTKADRNEYERVYRQFLETKKNVNSWLAVIGLAELDENSDVFVGYGSLEDGDENKLVVEDQDNSRKELRKITSAQKQIKALLERIDHSNFENSELSSFSADGIFCYIDKRIRRSSVQKYRAGEAWK